MWIGRGLDRFRLLFFLYPFFLLFLFPFSFLSPFFFPLEVGLLKSSWGALWVSPAGSRVWVEPRLKSNLMHYVFKIWDLVAKILIIFCWINWPNFVQSKRVLVRSGGLGSLGPCPLPLFTPLLELCNVCACVCLSLGWQQTTRQWLCVIRRSTSTASPPAMFCRPVPTLPSSLTLTR